MNQSFKFVNYDHYFCNLAQIDLFTLTWAESISAERRAVVFSSACLQSSMLISFPQHLSVGTAWMISNYHRTSRTSGANYGFMITCRLPSHQSDKHSNGVLAETSPTCLFPPPFFILSFVLAFTGEKGKNSHAWIMNVSSRLLGEASDTYQFSICHCHLRHTVCIHQATPSFFLHKGGIEKMSKCWKGRLTTLKLLQPFIISYHIRSYHIKYELNLHAQTSQSSVSPVRAVLMLTGWKPPLRAEESMMSESKSRWFLR